MLCCAFAAFILAQIVFAFDHVRERFLGLSPVDPALAGSASAAWRLGDPAPAPRPRTPRARRAAMAFAAGAAVFAASYAFSLAAPANAAVHAWHPSIWCSNALSTSGK